MNNLFERIRLWASNNNSKVLESLKPGASESQLLNLERALGGSVPAVLRNLLSIHNGQEGQAFLENEEGWRLMNTSEIAALHKWLTEDDFSECECSSRDGRVKAMWWNQRWIPVMTGPCGDMLAMDLDPTALGHPEQIIMFYHDEGTRYVEYATLVDMIETFFQDLLWRDLEV